MKLLTGRRQSGASLVTNEDGAVQLFFQDASDHMRKHGGQFEFGGVEGSHWVKRIR